MGAHRSPPEETATAVGIAENINVFDCELSAEEMVAIGLDTGRRGGLELPSHAARPSGHHRRPRTAVGYRTTNIGAQRRTSCAGRDVDPHLNPSPPHSRAAREQGARAAARLLAL